MSWIIRRFAVFCLCLSVALVCKHSVAEVSSYDRGLEFSRREALAPTSSVVRAAGVVWSQGKVENPQGVLTSNGGTTRMSWQGGAAAVPVLVLDFGKSSIEGWAVMRVKSVRGSPTLRLAYANYPDRDALREDGDFNEITRSKYMGRDIELPVLPANVNRHELYRIVRPGTFVAPMLMPQFRYMRVQLDSPGEIEIDSIEVHCQNVCDTSELDGYFKSSDPDMDRLWQIGVWTAQLAAIKTTWAWNSVLGKLQPRKLTCGSDVNLSSSSDLMPDEGSVSLDFECGVNPAMLAHLGVCLFASDKNNALLCSLSEGGTLRWVRRDKGADNVLRETVIKSAFADGLRHRLELQWHQKGDATIVSALMDGAVVGCLDYRHRLHGHRFGFWSRKGWWPSYDSLEIRDGKGNVVFQDGFEDASLPGWDFERPEPFVSDGTKRDRLVWSGDLYWAGRNFYYAFNDSSLMHKTIGLLARNQTPEGYVQACPYADQPPPGSGDLGPFESDEFAAWFIPVLHDYWWHTGDDDAARRYFPNVRKLLEYLGKRTGDDGLFEPRLETSKHAFAPSLQKGDVRHRSYMDILLWMCWRGASEMAAAIGEPELAERWAAQAKKTRHAANQAYWDEDNGRYRVAKENYSLRWDGVEFCNVGKMTKVMDSPFGRVAMEPNALAVESGFATPDQARRICPQLVAQSWVRKFILLSAIGKGRSGFGEDAWQTIATNRWSVFSDPAWDGPWTTAEGMDPPRYGSCDQSHPDVAPAGFISSCFLGVVPLGSGYSRFSFSPAPPDGLRFAEGRVPTKYGPIDARWKRTGDSYEFELVVPPGTRAEVRPPIGRVVEDNGRPSDGKNLLPGLHRLISKPLPDRLRTECVFTCGDKRCRLTWTGRTGWRLQSETPRGLFADEGAVQKLSAFMGESAPSREEPFAVEIERGERVCRASDGTQATISAKGVVRVFSADGNCVNEILSVADFERGCMIRGRLLDEEPVFGLGQRLDRLNHRGQRVELRTVDGWNDSATSYTVIPFFTTHRGGGVLVNLYEPMTADFGKSERNVWRFEVEKPSVDVYLFSKPTIVEALSSYGRLAGSPDVPEKWNAGPIICRYTPDLTILDGMATIQLSDGRLVAGYGVRNILSHFKQMGTKPVAVIIEGGAFVSMAENESRRQELRRISDYLKSEGVRLMVYMRMGDVCVRRGSGFREDFLARATLFRNGKPMEHLTTKIPDVNGWKGINPDMGNLRRHETVDVTNPEMWDWYMNTVWRDLVDAGVSGVKIDFCELMPDDGVTYGDLRVDYKWYDPSVFAGTSVHHSYPTFFISKFYREVSRLARDRGGFMVLSRGGGIGSQRNPYMWAGDQFRDYSKLCDQVLAVLNSGMSGIPFMTVDLAGYAYGRKTLLPVGEQNGRKIHRWRSSAFSAGVEAAIFRRGVEFATFMPCFQSHGYVMNVYEFDSETQAHYRRYVRLHEALGPYFAKLNKVAADKGVPPVRPLAMIFPDDRRFWNVGDEFMLGDALLVAPLFGESATREVVLPRGMWKRLLGLEMPVYLNAESPDAAEIERALAASGVTVQTNR